MDTDGKIDKSLFEVEIKRIDEKITLKSEQAVAISNERANAAALALASQVTSSAETLRSLVASTAADLATELGRISDRVTAIEQSQYRSAGSGSGMKQMYAWIFAGAIALITIGLKFK